MSQEGRGCLVGDQGGSDKVAQFFYNGGSEVRIRSSPWDPCLSTSSAFDYGILAERLLMGR